MNQTELNKKKNQLIHMGSIKPINKLKNMKIITWDQLIKLINQIFWKTHELK